MENQLPQTFSLKDLEVAIEEYEFIGDIFPKGEVSIIHGDAGSGKSYSVMKFLNLHGIEPIHVNLDYTPGLEEFKKINVDSNFLNKILRKPNFNTEEEKENFYKEIENQKVIIIDTYTVFISWFTELLYEIKKDNKKYKEEEIQRLAYNFFKNLSKICNVTVIVIGHTADFVGKPNIFRDNPFLIRNSAEALWLEKVEYKETKSRPAFIEYNLHINKGRGNGGARIIKNWMRDSIVEQVFNNKEHK